MLLVRHPVNSRFLVVKFGGSPKLHSDFCLPKGIGTPNPASFESAVFPIWNHHGYFVGPSPRILVVITKLIRKYATVIYTRDMSSPEWIDYLSSTFKVYGDLGN